MKTLAEPEKEKEKLLSNMSEKVFINCPYDKEYKNFFEIIIFLCAYFDYEPCFASERTSTEPRQEKIIELIQSSSIGIHDISRTKLTNGMPRFNMPFELGMYVMHIAETDKSKRILVIDGGDNDYRRTLSDLNCSDIEAHNDNEEKLVKIIRDFFVNIRHIPNAFAPKKILLLYKTQFKTWLFENLDINGYEDKEIDVGEFKIKVMSFFNNTNIINIYYCPFCHSPNYTA